MSNVMSGYQEWLVCLYCILIFSVYGSYIGKSHCRWPLKLLGTISLLWKIAGRVIELFQRTVNESCSLTKTALPVSSLETPSRFSLSWATRIPWLLHHPQHNWFYRRFSIFFSYDSWPEKRQKCDHLVKVSSENFFKKYPN